ncbi:putative NHL repeat-containing protein 2 [Apostichopus japonicus]|uniref:Putative NHL repeat-containing protein 2 n=1 Tax=Stichopus japonicus TaxID=307972 RepID=A0A2G8LEB5_STIJA|nr:putative NHL repeat-containing protein 2 [Apostichopus japonicus]
MWEDLDISCWPTLMVLGPSGEVLVSLVGEGNRDSLFTVCETAVEYYKSKGKLTLTPLPIELYKENLPQTPLSFPGKVAATGDKLAISDTGHHRILITTRQGVVLHCVGGKELGWVDGHYQDARFHSPQGVCWSVDACKVYVADTENHVIRMINLNDETVTTIAGVGVMGTDKYGGSPGRDQPLSSPWDVAVGPPHEDILFVAMAGNHTIWGLFLETATWQKGSEHKKGVCMNYAGSGKEENRNNSYPHRASFAQPSGLAMAAEDPYKCMFIADSESSSVRCIHFKDGAVKPVVGGERDPMNLFAYGDADGIGIDAKLQHPLGVAWNKEQQKLYVADSYNHKIKVIDPGTKSCQTFAGSGTPGKADSTNLQLVWFNEPGGLCVAPGGQEVYIADTNNHAIRILNLAEKSVKELPILFTSSETETDHKSVVSSITSKRALVIDVPPIDDGGICLMKELVFLTPVNTCSKDSLPELVLSYTLPAAK